MFFWENFDIPEVEHKLLLMFYRQDVVEMSEVKPLFFFFGGGVVGQRWWCLAKSQLAAFVGPSG